MNQDPIYQTYVENIVEINELPHNYASNHNVYLGKAASVQN